MGGCCASEPGPNNRPTMDQNGLKKKSGAMMGSRVPTASERRDMYANRPKIVLGYWKIRGLAQQIRYLLEYIQHPYEEVLFEQGDAPNYSIEQWTTVKDSLGLDFPNVPYIIDGDVKITDPLAIMVYLCHSYAPELLGQDIKQKAEIDMLHMQLKDIRSAMIGQCYISNDRANLKKNALSKSEALIKHIEGRPYVAGDNLTYLDFIFLELFDFIDFASEYTFYDSNDNVRNYSYRMKALPALKSYIASDRFIERPYNNKIAKINNLNE